MYYDKPWRKVNFFSGWLLTFHGAQEAEIPMFYTHKNIWLTSTDCQIYTATPVNLASSAVARFTRCLADVGDWMTISRLRLNPAKTQVLWLGSKFQIERVDIRQVPALSSAVHVIDIARDLGVTIDSRLTMADQVAVTCQSAYFQLITRSLFRCLKSSCTGVHHVPVGLQ